MTKPEERSGTAVGASPGPTNEPIDPKRHDAWFRGPSLPVGSRRVEALRYAHDIRKCEIELYWKRAPYFWTAIAVAFGGCNRPADTMGSVSIMDFVRSMESLVLEQ